MISVQHSRLRNKQWNQNMCLTYQFPTDLSSRQTFNTLLKIASDSSAFPLPTCMYACDSTVHDKSGQSIRHGML